MAPPPASLRVAALIFPGFEVLDLFGPIELMAQCAGRFDIRLVGREAGEVQSAQGVGVMADASLVTAAHCDVVLVPGGPGTRTGVDSTDMLDWLRRVEPSARRIASVCTGSALLARAGLLDGRRATSNKIAFDWVTRQGPGVRWVRRARWVEDGKFFTSSGVSAGMDMTLALITSLLGPEAAAEASRRAEYRWNADADEDPFA